MQARSRLYGRRIKGDIGPINIDPRTRLPGAILAPAVSLTGAEQYYDQASGVQNFTLGSRMVVDERVFHYARAGNELHCSVGAHVGFTQDVAFAVVTPITPMPAGTYTLVVTVANTDGRLGTGAIPEDELAGGNIVIWPDGFQHTINRRIVGNSERAAPGGAMTVTLDRPLPVALTPAPHAELIANRYLDVLFGNYDRYMIVGMPPIAAELGQYLWLQTWGPVWGTPDGLAGVGIDNSMVMFRGNGSIAEFDAAPAPPVGQCQFAGTIITPGRLGGQGAPFFNLMIAP